MKLAYQVATPEVIQGPGVTAYQGPLESSFRRLAECGYEGAELMVADPKRIDSVELKRLRSAYGLEIPMVCTGEIFGQDQLCFSDLDDVRRQEALRRAKTAVDLAAELGAQINIGRLRGGLHFGQPPALCKERAVQGIREVCEYALPLGVQVAIEPVNAIAINFINTTQEGIDLVREIGCPSCTLMLDSNHMFINDKDMVQSFYDAKDYVSYVHLVDSNRLYPGNCKLDFATLLATLRDIGYNGWLSVEIFQRPDQDTALIRSMEYLQNLLQ